MLLPATLRLCEDPVAAVREAAAAQLGGMVRSLLQQEEDSSGVSASGSGQTGGEAGSCDASSSAPAEASAAERQQGEQEAALTRGMEQLAVSGEQGSAAAAAAVTQADDGGEAAPAAPVAEAPAEPMALPAGAAGAARGPDQQEEEAALASAAPLSPEVQQIVRHMVELQRSTCHRARQTYLLFCTALLLPAAGPPPAAAIGGNDGGAAGPTAAAAAAALAPAVAGSGIVQGLLEGALALASDPVPNVRLGVARLLCALRRQQPQVADGAPRVAAALAALAADTDRDVAQTVAD